MNNGVWRRREFAMGLAALAGTSAVRAQSDERIVLGQSAPLSGPAAQLGIQFYQGAKLWFDQFNAQGGVGRSTVELRVLDDGYEPARCAQNTRQLIDEGAFALFGYIGTPTSLAALPLVTQAKVPFFAPFTGADALRTPFNRQVFHVRASYHQETALIVGQLTHLGLEKVAVFHQNDSYGQAGLDGVGRALAAKKLQPVAQATVERNSLDVGAAVRTILATKPDAVVQISTYASSAAFVREARKAGYGGTFHIVSFVGAQALANALGKDAAGVVVSQVVPSPFQPTQQLTREFLESIKLGGHKVQPNYSSLEGYLAARVFTEGLRRAQATAGKITRDALIAGLESIQSPVAGFPVAFSPTDHSGSRFVELSMLTSDGRVRT